MAVEVSFNCEELMIFRPYRSVLYIPGGRARALQKAREISVDAIIFDLEDAVAVAEKSSARATLLEHLRDGGYGARAQIVRINDIATDWGIDDLAAFAQIKPEALLLPKVNRAADILALSDLMDAYDGYKETMIWAMIETPRGIINAAEIADTARMGGLIVGTNDLGKELNSRFDPLRTPLLMALNTCVLAAKAAGIVAIDGVYNAFKDDEGLRREASQGRDMGFDGKTLIHPAQVALANSIFGPSPDEVDLAKRQISAFVEATKQGLGVAVLDGNIVENLHVETAHATLAKVEAISVLDGTS